jgi:hypothetical protein
MASNPQPGLANAGLFVQKNKKHASSLMQMVVRAVCWVTNKRPEAVVPARA